MIGKTISHYKILEKIGSGGMGTVYKARDTKLDRFVALKFLPPHLSQASEEKKRFIHEAKAASALDHSNICTIHEIGETDTGQMFIVMACYEGESLKEKIERGKLPVEEAVDITIQIAQGLKKAHAKKIIHRDIKPANILITEDNQVKIVDFGLAKLSGKTLLTKEGTTLGTVAYMSPEQTKGTGVDHRADIWALGVILYEMLAGERPFKGDYDQAVMYSILNEDPEPIENNCRDLPPGLTSVITKTLSKDPDKRYQTMGDLLSDLQAIGSKEYESQSFGSAKISKKHYQRWQLYILGVFILLVASIIYFTNPFGSDPRLIESIAVLPFENYTGSDDLDYFVAGMHSSLIGDIGKISALRVISKTTSNAYKNVEKSISEIASELRVDAVIEASVLSLGDSVRIQVKLVSAFPEEQQLWVQDFREEKSQILNLYNRVTKQISNEINVLMTPQEESLLAESRTVDPEAYDAYLRSYQYWDDLSLEGLNKGLEYLNLAIEKEPNWAPLYGALSQVWAGIAQMGFEAPEVAGPKIFEYLNKALELDPDFPDAHYNIAIIAVWQEWNWEKGEREFLKALEINPNDAMSRVYYSHLLWILNRYDEALFHSQMAVELDPMNPLVLALSAMVNYDDRLQLALEKSKKALEIDPEHYFALISFCGSSYLNGDFKNSIETELKTCPGLDDEAREAIMAVFQEKGYTAALETMLTYLEEYARTNKTGYFNMGEYYYRVGNLDKTIECYIKAYEMHDPMMPYITLPVNGFDQIKDDPRIISIVEKMNLPLQ